MVRFGIDRAAEHRSLFQGRTALLTAPSGRARDGRSTIEVLREICDLRILFAPEHGVRGDKGAGERVPDGIDGPSGLPVVSLYGGDDHALPPAALEQFDTLVYDIQDVGCRFYTFISTLRSVMRVCAGAGKRLVVLDRADPLGGTAEGAVLEDACRSFVGCCPIPTRYGLTCGEFAQMVNAEEKIGCDLSVVPCEGLTQELQFPDLGRLWIMPSLAMPRWETALLYAGTCLFEGTNCSEGRGTADPFGIIGAPFADAEELARAFNDRKLPGAAATPAYFVPYCSKHKGQVCGGVHLHVTDRREIRPTEVGLHLLDLMRSLYPKEFAILPAADGGLPFLSKLAGHRLLEDENWSLEALVEKGRRDSAAFRHRCEPFRLYGRRGE